MENQILETIRPLVQAGVRERDRTDLARRATSERRKKMINEAEKKGEKYAEEDLPALVEDNVTPAQRYLLASLEPIIRRAEKMEGA